MVSGRGCLLGCRVGAGGHRSDQPLRSQLLPQSHPHMLLVPNVKYDTSMLLLVAQFHQNWTKHDDSVIFSQKIKIKK